MNLTSAKAIRIIGVLRYNLQRCPQAIRSQAYATLLLSVLEYGPVLRDPSQQHQIQRLEGAQRQAARFVTDEFSSRDVGGVSTMLHQLDW